MNGILEQILGFIRPVQEKIVAFIDSVMEQLISVLGHVGIAKEDFLTGLLLFSLEICVLLMIIIGIMRLATSRKKHKDVMLAKELKSKLQEYLPGRAEKLKAVIAEMVPHDESWAAKSAEEATGYEKSLYSKILKIILREDMEVAMGIHTDVERLGESYHRIVAHLGDAAVTVSDSEGGGSAETEKIAELKSIVAKLRKEKQTLQDELEASIKSVDTIVKEYSRIYSDAPNKEGSEKLEKEIALLREKMGVHIGDDEGFGMALDNDTVVAAAGEVSTAGDMDVPDVDIEENQELKELREKTGIEKES